MQRPEQWEKGIGGKRALLSQVLHQNIQHFFIFLWQFVDQEMDGIDSRFWAATFFEKKKKERTWLVEHSEPNISPQTTIITVHLFKISSIQLAYLSTYERKKKSLFIISPLTPLLWSFLCGYSESLFLFLYETTKGLQVIYKRHTLLKNYADTPKLWGTTMSFNSTFPQILFVHSYLLLFI